MAAVGRRVTCVLSGALFEQHALGAGCGGAVPVSKPPIPHPNQLPPTQVRVQVRTGRVFTYAPGRYTTTASSHLISPEFVLASKVTTVALPRSNPRVQTCVTTSYLPRPVGSPRCRAN